MNSNHCQLFTILIGFRTASPTKKYPNLTKCAKFGYFHTQCNDINQNSSLFPF